MSNGTFKIKSCPYCNSEPETGYAVFDGAPAVTVECGNHKCIELPRVRADSYALAASIWNTFKNER